MHVFLFKEKTAYEMRISDWSSDVCSSDLRRRGPQPRVQDDLLRLCRLRHRRRYRPALRTGGHCPHRGAALLLLLPGQCRLRGGGGRQYPEFLRSEEHTSELQSLMRTSYADFRLNKK